MPLFSDVLISLFEEEMCEECYNCGNIPNYHINPEKIKKYNSSELFYKYMDVMMPLISSYPPDRSISNMKESVEALREWEQKGNIFPQEYPFVYTQRHRNEIEGNTDICANFFIEDWVRILPKYIKIITYIQKDLYDGKLKAAQDYYEEFSNPFFMSNPYRIVALSASKNILRDNSIRKERENKVVFNSFSYKFYTAHINKITELLKFLKEKPNDRDIKFISSDTNLVEFRKIFYNQVPVEPIIWTGAQSELRFFIHQILGIKGLFEPMRNQHWKIAKKIFVPAKGKTFTNLRGLKEPATAKYLKTAANLLT